MGTTRVPPRAISALLRASKLSAPLGTPERRFKTPGYNPTALYRGYFCLLESLAQRLAAGEVGHLQKLIVFWPESPACGSGGSEGSAMAGQPGFFDVEDRLKQLSAKGDALERLNAVVDFELFRADLEHTVVRSDNRGVAGRRLIMADV